VDRTQHQFDSRALAQSTFLHQRSPIVEAGATRERPELEAVEFGPQRVLLSTAISSPPINLKNPWHA
jgi:hypothetical protein